MGLAVLTSQPTHPMRYVFQDVLREGCYFLVEGFNCFLTVGSSECLLPGDVVLGLHGHDVCEAAIALVIWRCGAVQRCEASRPYVECLLRGGVRPHELVHEVDESLSSVISLGLTILDARHVDFACVHDGILCRALTPAPVQTYFAARLGTIHVG